MSLVHTFQSRKAGLRPRKSVDYVNDYVEQPKTPKKRKKGIGPTGRAPPVELHPESPTCSPILAKCLLPASPVRKARQTRSALPPARKSTARKRKRSVKSAKKPNTPGMKLKALFQQAQDTPVSSLRQALMPDMMEKSCTCHHCKSCEDLTTRCAACKDNKGPLPNLLSWRQVQSCEKCGVQHHKQCLPVEARVTKSSSWFCPGCAPTMSRANVRWSEHKLKSKEDFIHWKQAVEPCQAVKQTYQIFKKTDAVSGSGAGGAMYGEITQGSMQKVVSFLQQYTDMDETAAFLDLGSGLGKPSSHVAMASPGVNVSCGLELLDHCWGLSLVNLSNVLKDETLPKTNIGFVCGNATEIGSMNPFTHVYAFDKGWHPMDLRKLATIFNASASTHTLVSYHKPKEIIYDMGFAVTLLGKISVQMAGSSQGHTAFVYKRAEDALIPAAPKPLTPPDRKSVV